MQKLIIWRNVWHRLSISIIIGVMIGIVAGMIQDILDGVPIHDEWLVALVIVITIAAVTAVYYNNKGVS